MLCPDQDEDEILNEIIHKNDNVDRMMGKGRCQKPDQEINNIMKILEKLLTVM